jgi:hypothetical protein
MRVAVEVAPRERWRVVGLLPAAVFPVFLIQLGVVAFVVTLALAAGLLAGLLLGVPTWWRRRAMRRYGSAGVILIAEATRNRVAGRITVYVDRVEWDPRSGAGSVYLETQIRSVVLMPYALPLFTRLRIRLVDDSETEFAVTALLSVVERSVRLDSSIG